MAPLSQLDYFLRTIWHCFQRHEMELWRSSSRPSLLRWMWCEAQLEEIFLAIAESEQAVPKTSRFDRTGSGGFGQVFGLPFAQTPTNSIVISTHENRFYDGFGVWFRRARTVRGRLVAAQTMILLRLWHFAMQVAILAGTTRQWQWMPNQFVLDRNYKKRCKARLPDQQRNFILPKVELWTINSVFVGRVKLQRLQFLQQFASNASPNIPAHCTTA